MRPKQDDDEFFGDQEEPEVSRQTQDDGPEMPSLDELTLRDSRATKEQFRNIGYHQAYEEAKDARLQQGFEKGYRDCFEEALQIGEILGQATSPLNTKISEGDDPFNGDGNAQQVIARHVRSCLDSFEQKDPTTTPHALLTLRKELNEMLHKQET